MEPWELAQKKAEERNLEHAKRLKTPAMYALEVYLGVFTLEGLNPENFDDDIRVRFKLLDFACVEVKRYVEEGSTVPPSSLSSPTSPSSPSSPSSPTSPSSPSSPSSPDGTDTEPPEADPKPSESKTNDSPKEESKTESKKEFSKNDTSKTELKNEASKTDKPEGSKTDVRPDDPQAAGETTVGDAEQSVSSRTRAKERLKKDPRYFDPKKLLRQKPAPRQLNDFDEAEEDENEEDEGVSEVNQKSYGSETRKTQSGATQPSSSVQLPSSSGRASDWSSHQLAASDVPQTGSSVPDGDSQAAGSSLGPASAQEVESSRPSGAESHETRTERDSAFPTASPTEDDMEEAQDGITEEILSSFIHFENGKSIIFCKEPLNLLSSLPRYPLVVIFFRRPSEVLGIARVPLSALADAVDKSIVLTRSIPLSGIVRDAYDIFSRGRKVGVMNVDVRLSCFGPFLFHKIHVRDNPNDKSVHNMPVRKTSSQRLIVVEMSTANLGVVRHKSKIFKSKSIPTLVGRIQRDISNLPPIVCADENLLDPPPKPKPETNIVEEDERRKEEARLAKLSQFPQYKCIDDWEVIFTRNVIKDLIAKNRRPFQKGSADRKYVQTYFPELMPEKKGPKRFGPAKTKSQRRRCHCTEGKREDSEHHSLPFLPLDEAWLGENNIERIRRKSLRPPVTTSFSTSSPPAKPTNQAPVYALSGVSMVKLPNHTDKSMSHVAVAHFNMEKGSCGEEDSRVVGYKSPSNNASCDGDSVTPVDLTASHPAVLNLDTAKRAGPTTRNSKNQSLAEDTSIRNQGRVFNTKHPRINSSVERYNPLPHHPYMVELLAPERYPVDKLVQSLRALGKEVEEIGGDTKMLYDTADVVLDSDPIHPEHLKRSIRANLSPEASDVTDPGGSIGKTVLIEVEKGVPMAIHARTTPYWAGHAPVCDDPTNCQHFLLLHPGFGFYGK